MKPANKRVQVEVTPEVERVIAHEQAKLRRQGHPRPSKALALQVCLRRQAAYLPKASEPA